MVRIMRRDHDAMTIISGQNVTVEGSIMSMTIS